MRHRSVLFLALLCIVVFRMPAQQPSSEEEKRRAFLKAREEMTTIPYTPSGEAKPKPKRPRADEAGVLASLPTTRPDRLGRRNRGKPAPKVAAKATAKSRAKAKPKAKPRRKAKPKRPGPTVAPKKAAEEGEDDGNLLTSPWFWGGLGLVVTVGVTVLILSQTALNEPDVVTIDGARVIGVHVKPESPPSDLVWGCLAAKVGALEGLAGHTEPGVYLDALARGHLSGFVLLLDASNAATLLGLNASLAQCFQLRFGLFWLLF